jgi:tripartite-type tricarboxylate transporter receptor subunit TctC
MMRALRKTVVGLLAAVFAGSIPAYAQYPDKPIRMIVGFVPGGFTDVLARTIGQKLEGNLGKPVVVENKPGASGTIGADQVAKAKPDGYTLLMGHVNSNAIAPALYPRLPYDVIKDFTPIIHVASTPMLLTVNASVPAQDVKSFIELAKSGRGLTFASSGNGSVQHLAAELFMLATGTKMTHVPYKGSGQAIVDLVAGQVDLNFESPPNVLPHLRSGKVRVLAITSWERSPTLPDVPTLEEAGVKGAEVSQWFGVLGPANLPTEIVAKLNGEISTILKSPEVIERIQSQDGKILGGSAEEFAAFIKEDTARWAKLIKDANVRLD